jgi:hypothetical protein
VSVVMTIVAVRCGNGDSSSTVWRLPSFRLGKGSGIWDGIILSIILRFHFRSDIREG